MISAQQQTVDLEIGDLIVIMISHEAITAFLSDKQWIILILIRHLLICYVYRKDYGTQ